MFLRRSHTRRRSGLAMRMNSSPFLRLVNRRKAQESHAHGAEPGDGIFRNFTNCPHCMFVGQAGPAISSSGPWAPVITRSDGANFHLIFGDGPIFYPPSRSLYVQEMVSLGFWYVHDAKTAAVVVILRRPPSDNARLLHCVEQIADALAKELVRRHELPGLVEVDAREFFSATD